MADENSGLPEGTDKIIAGASAPSVSNSGAIGVGGATTEAADFDTEVLVVQDVGGDDLGGLGGAAATGTDFSGIGATGTGGKSTSGEGTGGGLVERLRSSSGNISGQAADKARGFVGQGLERSSEAIANASRLVGETASGIDERLGQEFGDYARRAASTMESLADSLATKDPDELIDDTREFVRRSPGVALAGAAVIGFALARLVKSGLTGVDTTGGTTGDSDRSTRLDA